MNTVFDDVRQWAKDKGILDNSTPQKQFLKTMAEFGELCDNLLKGRSIKDDVGDVLVTLIVGMAIRGEMFEYGTRKLFEEIGEPQYSEHHHIQHAIAQLLDYADELEYEDEIDTVRLIESIRVIASLQKLTLIECLKHSYAEIAGRTGKMENGAFVKDGDK